jgi:hypothetical protein
MALNLTQMRKDLHHGGGESALRKNRRPLHEENDGIVLHLITDAGLDVSHFVSRRQAPS